jgi:medium-chain acyl-[acyl-carrier-protein] hydrolase
MATEAAMPELELLCFPYAGGSALTFRGWPEHLPEGVALEAWEPAGHGRRMREAPHRCIDAYAREVADAIEARQEHGFALFGHSLGGLVAFEVARELRRRGAVAPRAILIAATSAPQEIRADRLRHRLPDDELLDELRSFNGTPTAVLEDEELLRLFLPVLRADFEAVETYRYVREEPLACPILVFGGLRDRVMAPETLEGWKEQTCSDFSLEWVPGDHFFPSSNRAVFLWLLCRRLEPFGRGRRERSS